MNVLVLEPDTLREIEHLAELRFSLSQIATMVHVDVVALRLAIAGGRSEIAEAYNAGRLRSAIARREALLTAANNGEEWAIRLLDKYEIDQREEELMP